MRRRVRGEELRALVLEHEVDRQRRPCWSVPTVADATWSPLNSGGYSAFEVEDLAGRGIVGVWPERDEVEPAGLADELADRRRDR